MAGKISTSYHTALFCVHKYMVRMRKIARASKIRRYIAKMNHFIKNIEAVFIPVEELTWFQLAARRK